MKERACEYDQKKSNDTLGHHEHSSRCHPKKGRPDFLLWGSLLLVTFFYGHYASFRESTQFVEWYQIFTLSIFELVKSILL